MLPSCLLMGVMFALGATPAGSVPSNLLISSEYQLDRQWIANARMEVFDDLQRQRTGFKGVYEAITSGVTSGQTHSIL